MKDGILPMNDRIRLARIVYLMDRPPMDHPPHAKIWTTDYDNLWHVDGGVRPDGGTVYLMDGNGR